MVSASFTCFLLIFILLPLRFSTAHKPLIPCTKRLVVGTGSMLETARSSVKGEHIYQGVPTVGESDQMKRLTPGRKMMSRGSTTKAKDGCIDGKCNQEEEVKGNLNVKHKLGKRSSAHYTNVNMSGGGFIPLNADYYVPRPHPPKNN